MSFTTKPCSNDRNNLVDLDFACFQGTCNNVTGECECFEGWTHDVSFYRFGNCQMPSWWIPFTLLFNGIISVLVLVWLSVALYNKMQNRKAIKNKETPSEKALVFNIVGQIANIFSCVAFWHTGYASYGFWICQMLCTMCIMSTCIFLIYAFFSVASKSLNSHLPKRRLQVSFAWMMCSGLVAYLTVIIGVSQNHQDANEFNKYMMLFWILLPVHEWTSVLYFSRVPTVLIRIATDIDKRVEANLGKVPGSPVASRDALASPAAAPVVVAMVESYESNPFDHTRSFEKTDNQESQQSRVEGASLPPNSLPSPRAAPNSDVSSGKSGEKKDSANSVKDFIARLRFFRFAIIYIIVPNVSLSCIYMWLTYVVLGQVPFQWVFLLLIMLTNSLFAIAIIIFVGGTNFKCCKVRTFLHGTGGGDSSSSRKEKLPFKSPKHSDQPQKSSSVVPVEENKDDSAKSSNNPRVGTKVEGYTEEYVKPGYAYLADRSRKMKRNVRHFNTSKMSNALGFSGDWEELIKRTFEDVEELCEGSSKIKDGWKLTHHTNGLDFEIPKDSEKYKIEGMNLNRVTAVLKVTPLELVSAMYSLPEVGSFDHSLTYARVLHHFPDHKTIMTHSVNFMGTRLIAMRDFVSILSYKERADGSFVYINLDVPEAYEQCEGLVRGAVVRFGYVMTPIPTTDGACRVRMVNQSLVRGFIPPALINGHLHKVLTGYLKGYEDHCINLRARNKTANLVKMLMNVDIEAGDRDDEDDFPGNNNVYEEEATPTGNMRGRGKSTYQLKKLLARDHEKFTEFVRSKYAGEVLEFYDKCVAFEKLLDGDDRKKLAAEIIELHVKPGAWKAVDLPDDMRNELLRGVESSSQHVVLSEKFFTKAQNVAFNELKANFYHQFLKSKA